MVIDGITGTGTADNLLLSCFVQFPSIGTVTGISTQTGTQHKLAGQRLLKAVFSEILQLMLTV
jgi:hypothetical protein